MKPSYIVFDTETSGETVFHSFPRCMSTHVIQCSWALYDYETHRRITPTRSFYRYPDDFTVTGQEFHNITHETTVKEGIPCSHLLYFFRIDLEDPSVKYIVGHNVRFDIKMMATECIRYKDMDCLEALFRLVPICSLEMSRSYSPGLPAGLGVIYKRLFPESQLEGFHNASIDVYACQRVFVELSQRGIPHKIDYTTDKQAFKRYITTTINADEKEGRKEKTLRTTRSTQRGQ